jgi:hypothetical protein
MATDWEEWYVNIPVIRIEPNFQRDEYNLWKIYFFIILSGVRLSPLGTVATTGLLYQTGRIVGGDCGAIENKNGQGKLKYSKKTCSRSTLSIKNPTWTDSDSNPNRRCGKSAATRLSYGAADNL